MKRFIGGLFENRPVIEPETKARLRAVILQTYEEMLGRKRLYPDKKTTDILVEFLEGYEKKDPQAAEAREPSRLLRKRDES